MHISEIDQIIRLKQARDSIIKMKSRTYRVRVDFPALELTRQFEEDLHKATNAAVDELLDSYLARIDDQLSTLGIQVA